MKVRYIYIALVALLGGIFWGCSDWTEVESKDFFNPPTDSYYEALREYKKVIMRSLSAGLVTGQE